MRNFRKQWFEAVLSRKIKTRDLVRVAVITMHDSRDLLVPCATNWEKFLFSRTERLCTTFPTDSRRPLWDTKYLQSHREKDEFRDQGGRSVFRHVTEPLNAVAVKTGKYVK
jgi:hypothetical protein